MKKIQKIDTDEEGLRGNDNEGCGECGMTMVLEESLDFTSRANS